MKEGTEMQEAVRMMFEGQQTVSICVNQEENESVTFYKEDYESLLPYRWLRTQAVDLLIKLHLEQQRREIRKIQNSQPGSQLNRFYIKAMDAFVVTLIMTDQENFVLESLEPLGLFSEQTKYLLIPLNTENSSGSHWLLGLLIRQEHHFTLTIFDSGSSYQVGQDLRKRISHLYRVLNKSEATITLQSPQNIIYQSNSFDCGIFAVGYSEYILKQVVNSLEQNRKPNFNTLSSHYKYLLVNSTHTRDRYRRLIQQLILKSSTQ